MRSRSRRADAARSSLTAARAIALAVALTAPLIAEEPATFEDRTDVVLIEVPVQVLLNGAPVAGLSAENFELFDNGRRRKLFSFEVLDFSDRAGVESLPTTHDFGPRYGPRRNFLFLIDFAYPDSWDPEIGAGPITAAVHGMMESWRDLAELLEARFHADDRIALAYFSPLRGLKILQGWTSDREPVAQAMEILRLMIEAEPKRLREAWWDWEMTARSSRSVGPIRLWATLDDLLAESRTAGVRADPFLPHQEVASKLFEGLINAGKTLDDAAGPRHVIYLSTGFPGASLRDLRVLTQQFRRTHWSIQSVYTGGLGFGSDSLHLLSNETGGQVFSNSNDVAVLLDDMVEQTSVTYALMIEASGDAKRSKYHKLKVKLVGGPKGARVVHRPGYYSPEQGESPPLANEP